MSTELERVVEAHFIKRCKAAGYWQSKFVSPGHSGMPDRIVGVRKPRKRKAEVWFVELKREGEKARPLQAVTHEEMRAAGLNVVVLAGRAEVDAWFESAGAPA